ncbi:hypothetical protein GCM10028792_31140 [Salinisphaera aquimarina]
MYGELVQQEKYIARYQQLFGPSNVLVISHESIVEDTKAIYKQILSFLNISDDYREDFPRVNSNKVHKSKVVRSFLRSAAQQRWAVSLLRTVKARLGIGSFGLYRYFATLNVKEVPRDPVPETLRREIDNYS